MNVCWQRKQSNKFSYKNMNKYRLLTLEDCSAITKRRKSHEGNMKGMFWVCVWKSEARNKEVYKSKTTILVCNMSPSVTNGDLAQLVERVLSMHEVWRSIRQFSTWILRFLRFFRFFAFSYLTKFNFNFKFQSIQNARSWSCTEIDTLSLFTLLLFLHVIW